MKFLALLSVLCAVSVISLSISSKHKHKSKVFSKVHHKAKLGEKADGDNKEEEVAPPELDTPLVNGNYFDSGSYLALSWLSKSGEPDGNALIFIAKCFWTESYIYFKKTTTLNKEGDAGSALMSNVFLFSPDTHDAYLPYYFFVDGKIEYDSKYSSMSVATVDKKIFPLFEFTKQGEGKLHMTLLSSSDLDNVDYIIKNRNLAVKNAYELYNKRVMLIRDSIEEITKIKEEIFNIKAELKKKLKVDMFKYYTAKAEIIKTTLNADFAAILDEIENQENTKEVAARKMCDNIYINGDFQFFRNLMGEEWTKNAHNYDYSLDTSAGHLKEGKDAGLPTNDEEGKKTDGKEVPPNDD